MKIEKPNSFFLSPVAISFSVWLFCVLSFIGAIFYMNNTSMSESKSDSMLLILLLLVLFGVFSFGIGLIATTYKFQKKKIKQRGKFLTFFKIIFLLSILPIFLLWNIIQPKKNILEIKKLGFKKWLSNIKIKRFLLKISLSIISIIMLLIWAISYAIASGSLQYIFNPDSTSDSTENQIEMDQEKIDRPHQIFNLTNQDREKKLEWNECLATTAKKKAEEMFYQNYFDHKNPTTETVVAWEWIANCYPDGYQYAGENLGMDFETAFVIHDAWMNSPKHKENIIDEKYEEMGVGCFEQYCVQHFATEKFKNEATENTAKIGSENVSQKMVTCIDFFDKKLQVSQIECDNIERLNKKSKVIEKERKKCFDKEEDDNKECLKDASKSYDGSNKADDAFGDCTDKAKDDIDDCTKTYKKAMNSLWNGMYKF